MTKTAAEALAEFDAIDPPSPAALLKRAEEAEASAEELEELGNYDDADEERALAAKNREAALRAAH